MAAATEKTTTPKIYGALLAVQEGLANVPKNGKMAFGNTNYEYLRADDVQEKLNPLLTANKIIVQPSYTVDTIKRGRGEGVDYVYINLTLNYIHAEDGSSLFAGPFTGESQASDDKSINKALTQAIKNAHRATFQFASGEPEPDNFAPKAEKESAPNRALENARKAAAPKPPAKPKAADNSTRATIQAEFVTPGLIDGATLNEQVRLIKMAPDYQEGTEFDILLERLRKGEVS